MILNFFLLSLWWRHNDRDGVSNHQSYDCLLNRLFRHRSKKTSKLRVTGLCEGNSQHKGPVTRKIFHLMTSSCWQTSLNEKTTLHRHPQKACRVWLNSCVKFVKLNSQQTSWYIIIWRIYRMDDISWGLNFVTGLNICRRTKWKPVTAMARHWRGREKRPMKFPVSRRNLTWNFIENVLWNL